MSAFGPKQTSLVALHMSAFGGKADMTVCRCPLLRSLLGVQRTLAFAPHMSASDPKRTFIAVPLWWRLRKVAPPSNRSPRALRCTVWTLPKATEGSHQWTVVETVQGVISITVVF